MVMTAARTVQLMLQRKTYVLMRMQVIGDMYSQEERATASQLNMYHTEFMAAAGA